MTDRLLEQIQEATEQQDAARLRRLLDKLRRRGPYGLKLPRKTAPTMLDND